MQIACPVKDLDLEYTEGFSLFVKQLGTHVFHTFYPKLSLLGAARASSSGRKKTIHRKKFFMVLLEITKNVACTLIFQHK